MNGRMIKGKPIYVALAQVGGPAGVCVLFPSNKVK
jgi:hypothetical protein